MSGVLPLTPTSPESKALIKAHTLEIHRLSKRVASDVRDIGEKLIEVKALLKHGEFGDWLATEFGWTPRTATRFMNVARVFRKADLSDRKIAPSALYALAAPSTPAVIREEFMLRASDGAIVTRKMVEARKKDFDQHEGRALQDLITPQPEVIKPKTDYEQGLEQIGYEDASRLSHVYERAIQALTALATYDPVQLEQIAQMPAGHGFNIPYMQRRLEELMEHLRPRTQQAKTLDMEAI